MKPFRKPSFRDSKPSWKSSNDRSPAMLHAATCNECGNQCQVPFKPNGKKPVLCNDCFKPEGRSFGDRPSFRERPSRDERPSYGDKPSFRDRAPREEYSSFRAPSVPASNELRELNAKLDRILVLLEKHLVVSTAQTQEAAPEEPKPKKAWAKIKYDK